MKKMFSTSEDTHHSNKLDLIVSNIKEKTKKKFITNSYIHCCICAVNYLKGPHTSPSLNFVVIHAMMALLSADNWSRLLAWQNSHQYFKAELYRLTALSASSAAKMSKDFSLIRFLLSDSLITPWQPGKA